MPNDLIKKSARYAAFAVVAWAALFAFFGAKAYFGLGGAKDAAKDITQKGSAATVREARAALREIRSSLSAADSAAGLAFPLRLVPGIGGDYADARRVLAAADDAALAGEQALAMAVSSIPGAEDAVLSALPSLLGEARLPDPDEARRFAKTANGLFEDFPDTAAAAKRLLADEGVRERLGDKASLAEEALSAASFIRDAAAPYWASAYEDWLPLYPYFAGYERPAEFFIVIQNNAELRPTGGFFGTYGRMVIDRGRVGLFSTDNVYSLDYPAKAKMKGESPYPLATYLKEPVWFLRDANWFFSWPDSAENIQRLYRAETGRDNTFTSVVAVNPEFVKKLFALAGPIELGGKRYDADNLIDLLGEEVGRDYQKLGKNLFNRKEIIGQLKDKLVASLRNLPPAGFLALPGLLDEARRERSLMLYAHEKRINETYAKYGWDGSLAETEGDYLAVVDSNLGSLKSDPAVKRAVTVDLDPARPRWRKVTVSYDHRGSFDWKTTRYRTWLRLYVPEGSELLSARGLLVMDRNPKEGKAEISEESGKTVLAGFTNVEPGTKRNVTWEYEIPDAAENLYVQKQPGIVRHWTVRSGSEILSASDSSYDETIVLGR